MKDSKQISVRLIATTPTGDIPIRAEYTEISLPVGPQDSSAKSELSYGLYLEAVHHLLLRNDCEKVLESIAGRLGRVVKLDEIGFIEIRTEKHGNCYHVARADFSISGEIVSFAVNVAVSDEVRSELEQDFRLLRKLKSRYGYHFLPQVYFKGAGRYMGGNKGVKWLHMFVAEWFRGYHEFHLHLDQKDRSYRMLMWDLDRSSRYLSQEQCLEVYRQAARILTVCYDWSTFKQIYPWQHAAGDFVLKEDGGRVDLRLVTVRDYAAVVDFATGKKAGKLLALILFFLHLTIQMRIDRLDGVGDVVWAEDYCLEGVVSGFLEGLTEGEGRGRRGMPSPLEIHTILRNFTGDEWLEFLIELLGTYSFSQEELSLIRDHGDGHIERLQQVLTDLG
ncbi:MAG: hypothetical protein JSU72_12710 [Deltaproteobacteria bacterium]|nr:MAG: hypothetical protein JSU72_12710 [Deltaproteobacteria bacterium]